MIPSRKPPVGVKVFCTICRGTCRLELGRGQGDPFKVWAAHDQEQLRLCTMPEWFTLLKKYFNITGVRLGPPGGSFGK